MKVFWSWQSDHPGEISRHFVRDALQEAIEALNATPEITEAERPADISLDHDRKGVPGSPDLANVILEKIASSQVFVADVTPVGESVGKPVKKLMNPNVAIELGFALAEVTDRGLLMVLNEHFGEQQELPFDLRHKAGPVTYRLAPGAAKEEIKKQRAELVGHFKVALREMQKEVAIRPVAAAPFAATASLADDPSRYVAASELLVERPSGVGKSRYLMPKGPLLYLRLIPTRTLSPLGRANAHDLIRRGNPIDPFHYPMQSNSTAVNKHGAFCYSASQDDSLELSGTQLFLNREIWGFDSVLLRKLKGQTPGFPTLAVEQTFAYGLRQYVKFAADKLELAPPFAIEAGATGVRNFVLYMPPNYWPDKQWGPVVDDQVVWKGQLRSAEPSEIDRVLLAIYEAVFDSAGRRRPPGLYAFPGAQPGAFPTG